MYKSTFYCVECEIPVKLDLFPYTNINYEEICCLTGRTGRAGRGGKAVTFFTEDDAVNLRRSVKRFKRFFCVCFREKAVTNVVRTCSPTPLFVLSVVQRQ